MSNQIVSYHNRRSGFTGGGGGLGFDKTNLEAWWNLDDDSTWADAHTNGYDLAETGTGVTNITNGGADGSSDSADFPGTSGTDYLSRTSEAWMDITVDHTLICWIRPDTVSGTQVWFDKYTGPGFSLYSSNAQVGWYVINVNTNLGVALGDVLAANTWAFIALRRTGDDYDVRVDSTDLATFTDPNTGTQPTNSTAALGIGRRTTNTTAVIANGQMQRVSWWSRSLSNAELTDLYNSGNGVSYADL